MLLQTLTMPRSAFFGFVSDHMRSRQSLLVFGLVAFAGSTGMLCAGTSVGLFVAGRLFQGMSAATVWTAGLALLADNVEQEELGKCLGFISMSMSAGTFLGPLLGGVVYDNGGYYAVYAMAFALIGLDLFLRLVLIERSEARKYSAVADRSGIEEVELRRTPPTTEDVERGSEVATAPNDQTRGQMRSPVMIWLLGSRRLLVALFAAMVFGTMLTSFDAVRASNLRGKKKFFWDFVLVRNRSDL